MQGTKRRNSWRPRKECGGKNDCGGRRLSETTRRDGKEREPRSGQRSKLSQTSVPFWTCRDASNPSASNHSGLPMPSSGLFIGLVARGCRGGR